MPIHMINEIFLYLFFILFCWAVNIKPYEVFFMSLSALLKLNTTFVRKFTLAVSTKFFTQNLLNKSDFNSTSSHIFLFSYFKARKNIFFKFKFYFFQFSIGLCVQGGCYYDTLLYSKLF